MTEPSAPLSSSSDADLSEMLSCHICFEGYCKPFHSFTHRKVQLVKGFQNFFAAVTRSVCFVCKKWSVVPQQSNALVVSKQLKKKLLPYPQIFNF